MIARILRKIRQMAIRYSHDPRPASYPYISGDGFRKLADHIHDETQRVDPGKVHSGEIIFVASDKIEEFFADIHSRINARYVLITHNGDKNIGPEEAALIDYKITHWFAQNVLVEHPKITPIPIGLENKHFANAGWPALYDAAQSRFVAKNGRILVAFSTFTNPAIREKALESLRKNPLADVVSRIDDQEEYLKLLASYSFVASPAGNGVDCHRTWEALYAGATPIVERSFGMEYFKSLGLDIVVIDSWDAIEAPQERKEDNPSLFFDYWKQRILQTVRDIE